MKLCLTLLLMMHSTSALKKTFNMGNGDSLTLAMDFEDRSGVIDEDTDGAVEECEKGKGIAQWKKSTVEEPSFDTLRTHDCTVKPFDFEIENKKMPKWIARDGILKKYKKYKKWNHAYGIPIFGAETFSDDSMRRACYLVRYLFADNEHFRRYAWKSHMRLVGKKGGFCCPPNMGNAALSCSCDNETPLYVITPEHEIGHWWLKYVAPQMVRDGLLKLPEWEAANGWDFSSPSNSFANKSECVTKNYGDFGDFLWNVRMQRIYGEQGKDNVILPVKSYGLHHYAQYRYITKYLSFGSGGQGKTNRRQEVKEQYPNAYKLLRMLWPCDNQYLSVCEDSAYGMKKGAAQKFLIGQRSDDDTTKMVCKDIDQAEVDEQQVKLQRIAADDVLEGNENDSEAITKIKSKCKCERIAGNGGWIAQHSDCKRIKKVMAWNAKNGKEWDWEKSKNTAVWQQNNDSEYELKLEEGVVANTLADSNEWAWYLRKCCARSAQIGLIGAN